MPRSGSAPNSHRVVMTEIHHIGIRVGDLDAAIRVLGLAFAVEVSHDLSPPAGGRRIAHVEFSNCRLELIHDPHAPLPGDQQAVIDHIAIGSPDIDRDMSELSRRGFASLDDAPRKAAFGNLVAAYDDADFSGIKLHLVAEKGE